MSTNNRCWSIGESSLADWLTLFVAIVGFGLTYKTIRDAEKMYRSSTYGVAAPWILEWDKTMLEQTGTRALLYAPVPHSPLAEPEEAVAEYTLDTFDSYLSMRGKYGDMDIDPSWTEWMTSVLEKSAVLRIYLRDEKHRSFYRTGEFYRKVYRPWLVQNVTEPQDPTPAAEAK